MSSTPQHEDPVEEWVAAKLEATSAKFRKIRWYPLILLMLGVACLISMVLKGFAGGSVGVRFFVMAMQESPHQLIAAAICFHGLATRQTKQTG